MMIRLYFMKERNIVKNSRDVEKSGEEKTIAVQIDIVSSE
jgi:hypothetical protein